MAHSELRASQLITAYGPGSLVDLPDDSIIVAGLDQWNYDNTTNPMIEEPRLVGKLRKLLGVSQLTLRTPPPASDKPHGFHPSVVGWRFPEWFLVQETVTTGQGHRRRRLIHLNSLEKGRYRETDGKLKSVVPVRFVRACKKGHVGDIDWKAFVHATGGTCHRDLWFEERGTSGDLDETWVVCACGADRAMSQAARMQLKALGHCNGSRPWLGAGTREKCGEINRLLIPSASNAYFAQKMSVISIPDARSPVDDVVKSLWEDFLVDVEKKKDLERMRQKPTVAAKLEGIDDADVWASIQRIRGGDAGADRPVKEVEFEALSAATQELGSDTPNGDFFARTLPATVWSQPWMDPIERVVLVHRLREVVAQVGFTRFEAAGPDIDGELDMNVERAPLAIDSSWLPAIENRGEGIFLQFKSDMIDAWLKKSAVTARGRDLLTAFDRWKADRESGREYPGTQFYMLHSLAHMLLTAISLECGYPASSLRERIYSAPDRHGILIYTGSSDSEGTLGGLALAGREIHRHMRQALELGLLCSNDPVCAYHSPGGHDGQPLLGSACHGCLLVSETSCEQRNELLDRALVVQTLENLGAEFFRP
jgi:hypothetical protein